MHVYRSIQGSTVVNLRDDHKDMPYRLNHLLYSPNGVTFYRAVVRGAGSGSQANGRWGFHLSFEVPQIALTGDIYYVMNEDGTHHLQIGEQAFHLIGTQMVLTSPVVDLPDERIPVYFYAAPNNTFFYVDDAKYSEGYGTYKFYTGTLIQQRPANVREIKITSMQRAKDGGTTYVETVEGELYVPTSFKPDGIATWRDIDESIQVPLVKLDRETYHTLATPAVVVPRVRPSKKLLVSYTYDGYYGKLTGLFICTKDELNDVIGKSVQWGEKLGKHSDCEDDLTEKSFKIDSEDQDLIRQLEKVYGATIIGYNPINWLAEYGNED